MSELNICVDWCDCYWSLKKCEIKSNSAAIWNDEYQNFLHLSQKNEALVNLILLFKRFYLQKILF